MIVFVKGAWAVTLFVGFRAPDKMALLALVDTAVGI
jgi:hypothetical protein